MSKNSFLLFTLLLWLGPFDCAQSETYPVIICDMNYRVEILPKGEDIKNPPIGSETYHHCGEKSETLDGCRFKGKIALEFFQNNERVKIYNSGTNIFFPIYDVDFYYYDLGYSDIIVNMEYRNEVPKLSGGTVYEYKSYSLNKHLNTIYGFETIIEKNKNAMKNKITVTLSSIGECKGEMYRITRR